MQRYGRRALVGAMAIAALAVPSSAGAATQIGATFTPTGSPCGSNRIWLQTFAPGGQYTAPFAGVISSWSYHAAASDIPQLKLKVARPVGGDDFMILGEEGPRTPIAGMLNTYPARIPVQAGDLIGLHVGTPGGLCGRLVSGWGFHRRDGDPPPGATFTFGSFPTADFQLDVSATLEPDCDQDGLGDETQDPELSPTQACDPNPPIATITKGPPDKTKKATATFTFAGTDARAIASFQCKLDAAALVPCTSPYKVRVKKGKHTFQVQAIDQAGNVGAPATDTWKRKKKKRKK